MKVPLVELVRQYKEISVDIDAGIKAVLGKGVFILGENVAKFEEETANYCGTKYAVAVANGTDALELSLKALGIGEGDEVITAPFTFIATTEAICVNGATPVLVDIENDTYNIDPSLIEAKITKKTKAMIPVHLFGHPCDIDSVMTIAKRHNLKVIEDCAQAIGAEFNSKRVGGFGDIGCFSFFPSKNLGCYGDGGMVITDDKTLADKIRMLRVHGQSDKYRHEVEGRNSRLDELQAAILRVKIKHLDRWNDARRRNAQLYNSFFKDLGLNSRLKTPTERQRCRHVYNIYNIRTKNRDGLRDFLTSKQVSTAVYYPIPLHLQKVYDSLGYKKGDFPNSESASLEVLALPIFPELKEEEIKFVASSISDFLS